MTNEEQDLIREGQNDGFKQVVAQLTKNLIDGTMQLPRYKMQVEEARVRLASTRP